MRTLIKKLFPAYDICTPEGELYLRRWTILRAFGFKIMLHHIILPDYSRDMHDHPWRFFTLVLKGWYRERSNRGIRLRRRWRMYYNGAGFAHVIQEVPKGGAWTLVLRGHRYREWGFLSNCGWQHWKKYTDKIYNSIPVCEDERTCRVCGCTEQDCSQCIKKTGKACYWVEWDLCSACSTGKKFPEELSGGPGSAVDPYFSGYEHPQ